MRDKRQQHRSGRGTERWEDAPVAAGGTGMPRSPTTRPPTAHLPTARPSTAPQSGARPSTARPSTARPSNGAGPRRRIRWPGVALVLTAVVVLLGLVWQVAEATAGAFGEVTAAGPARPEDVVGALAGGAMFALLLWLLLAVVASTLAAVRPAGPHRGTVVERVAPVVLRHLVAALIGAAVVGAATPAGADVGAAPASCATPWTPVATTHEATSTSREATSREATSREASSTTREAAPAGLSAAWNPTGVVSPGWLPTEPVVRPPGRPGADPSFVTSSRRRATATIDDEVVVRRGDTLWSLAERHLGPAATAVRVNQEWPRWFAANRSVLTRGPDHLVAGMRLTPPPLLAATGTESARAGSKERLR